MQRHAESGELLFDGIGLFFGEAQLAEGPEIRLFLVNRIDSGLSEARIAEVQALWGDLDARRLEESGLEPIVLARDEDVFGSPGVVYEAPRPGGAGTRYMVHMASGDLVCLN